MMPKTYPSACLAALMAMAPLSGNAQERLDLVGGFQPDPSEHAYSVTGAYAAGDAVRGCPGFAGEAPSLTVGLQGANAPLHVYLVGEGLAGVVVAAPDGIFGCESPDIYGITHFRFGKIQSGDFQVWPLAAQAGATASGTLLISEIDLGPRDVAANTGLHIDPSLLPPLLSEVPLDPSAEPAFGRHAMPAPGGTLEVGITLAGGVPADDAGPGCVGLITQNRPDVTLSLGGLEPVLGITATSDHDTTLLVVAPDGSVYCNDDAANYNPAVVLNDAAPGEYAIWAGVYAGGEGQAASVRIGREVPEGAQMAAGPVSLDPTAQPALGYFPLPGGNPLEVVLVLGGGGNASEVDGSCSGEIDPSRPDAVVSLDRPEPEMWISAASGSADTTLLVMGPDGSISCNDDHDVTNAALQFAPAEIGDYAIWVGSYGQAGAEATLTVGRTEPGGGMTGGMTGGTTGGEMGQMNPFAGVQLESAAQALAILTDTLGLNEVLSFESLEETGPEGFILHDVTLTDPTGAEQPVKIAAIRVSDLDLAGLSAYGAPERFALAVEGIPYDDLAGDAATMGVPLPQVGNAAPLSVSVSLLPPGGDTTRRELKFALGFEGQLALALGARMVWPEGATAMGPMGAAMMIEGEAVEVELHDMGFLGATLREAAKESGQAPDELIAQSLQELASSLAPMTPGSPQERLYQAVAAKLNAIDQSGRLRISFRAAQPMAMDALMEALSAEPIDESVVKFEAAYTPDQ